jgi:hypothetical protein
VAIGGTVIEQLPGCHLPLRQLKSGFVVQEVDWRDDPSHTEEWADRESAKYGGRRSVYWRQNYERELIRGGLPVWPMLDRQIHVRVVPGLGKSAEWALFRSLDPGFRHPCCCAWVGVNRTGDRHFYRQYYATDRTIALNAKAILEATPKGEMICLTMADPSSNQREPLGLQVIAEVYAKEGLPLIAADNSRAGYEWLTAGFISALARWAVWKDDVEILRRSLNTPTLTLGDAERLGAAPAITFDPSCASGPQSLFEQCVNFRWREQTGDPEQRAAPQEFVDKDDEGPDVVRYACQSPEVHWRPPVSKTYATDLMSRILNADKARKEQGRRL